MLKKFLTVIRANRRPAAALFCALAVLCLLALSASIPANANARALTQDSFFTHASNAPAAPQNTWDGFANDGLNGSVFALAVRGTHVYVGGSFEQTGDGAVTNLNNIAKYDTVSHTWSALPNSGLNGGVYAIAIVGTDVYVGGTFTQTFDGVVTELNQIAKYDTVGNTWALLAHNGLNNDVNALAVNGATLYVGGNFSETNDTAVTNLNNIAKYDTGSSVWSALAHNGLDSNVNALALDGTDLYVGGNFIKTFDTAVTNVNYVAKYDTVGSTWAALANTGLDDTVNAFAVMGTDLYVGGTSSQTYDGVVTGLNYIAKYDTVGGMWSPLGFDGLNDTVDTLAVVGTNLYVGGDFTQTNDTTVTNLNYIARYDATVNTWKTFPNDGLSNPVYAMAVDGTGLYVGGRFTATHDNAITNLNNITGYITGGGEVTNFRGEGNKRGYIVLHWNSTDESQITGFNVWRKKGKGAWAKINAKLKPAKYSGTSQSGAYRFTDKKVVAGKKYRYQVEVVYLDGDSGWTQIVNIKAK